MRRLLTRLYGIYLGFAAALMALTRPAGALANLSANPSTGDSRPMGWIMIALGISLIVIIVVVIITAKNRKK